MSTQSIEVKPMKLTRKRIRESLGGGEVPRETIRYMVDQYYQMQDVRKASINQLKAIERGGETLQPFTEQVHAAVEAIERQIQSYLDEVTNTNPVSRWAKSICGVGPVIAAGLLAHIDITKAPTVGHIWRFAGLDPTLTWEKKTKRPWNAELKTLCWKIGECFVKVSARDEDFYGKVYIERKEKEQARNMAGELAGQAKTKLENFKIGKDTEARKYYEGGFLPPAHIHSRAKRYAVKLFLAHYHQVAYWTEYGIDPPKPYVIEHMGHAHMIQVPNWSR
jgi:hypothetical protein